MNKADLIEVVANNAGISKTKAAEAIKAFTDAVTETIANDGRVTLVGFGTFKSVERKARTGRNPKTGVEIAIPAKKVMKFTAGANFKKQVNA